MSRCGPAGSFLISSDLCFVFSCAQLMPKLLRRLQRASAVFFRNSSRSVEHLQDRVMLQKFPTIREDKYLPCDIMDFNRGSCDRNLRFE
jgi:hypothetical protein